MQSPIFSQLLKSFADNHLKKNSGIASEIGTLVAFNYFDPTETVGHDQQHDE